LREEASFGLGRADAVVIVGDDRAGVRDTVKKHADIPVYQAAIRPLADNPDLFGKAVYAFAGIGRPEKFKDTLMSAGAMVEGWSEFPDHYAYIEEDLRELISAAEASDALIVTTAKDYVRLPAALQKKVQKFQVQIEWQGDGASGVSGLLDLIDTTLARRGW